MLKVHIEGLPELQRKFKVYLADTGKTASDFVVEVGKLACSRIATKSFPKTLAKGKKAIDKDIRKVYVSARAVSDLIWSKNKQKSIAFRYLVKKERYGDALELAESWVADISGIKALPDMEQLKGRRSKASGHVQNRSDDILTAKKAIKNFRKEAYGTIGIAKSVWAKAANKLSKGTSRIAKWLGTNHHKKQLGHKPSLGNTQPVQICFRDNRSISNTKAS